MSGSDTPPRRHVVIEAENPAVEIHVLDHTLQRVERGWGRLDCELAPGLYLAKFKAGAMAQQEPLVVEPGAETLYHRGERIALPTATPVFDLPNSHEYQSGPAHGTSRQIHVDLGGDAEIFLFAREAENQQYPWSEPGRGILLRRPTGETVVDMGVQGERYAAGAWAAVNVRLTPGTYVLRSEHPDAGIVEMAVVASSGLQTQVFLTLSEFTFQAQRTLRLPDLATASVHMTPLGHGFDPNPGNPWPKLTAIALAALGSARKATNAEELRHMLRGKFEDPMLGILGAHILLLDPEPDRALLDEVVRNLSFLVGDHPDMLAVRKWLGDSSVRFPEPPMLASSWRIASETRAVPAGSYAAHVALAAGITGPWFTWRADHLPNREVTAFSSTRSFGRPAEESLLMVQSALRLPPTEAKRLQSTLTPAAQRAMQAMLAPATIAEILEAEDDAQPVVPDLEALTRQMQVPPTVAESALEEIADKLESGF